MRQTKKIFPLKYNIILCYVIKYWGFEQNKYLNIITESRDGQGIDSPWLFNLQIPLNLKTNQAKGHFFQISMFFPKILRRPRSLSYILPTIIKVWRLPLFNCLNILYTLIDKQIVFPLNSMIHTFLWLEIHPFLCRYSITFCSAFSAHFNFSFDSIRVMF